LELERPHTKLMPYVVEGYGVVDSEFQVLDLLPKGIEIRTPIADSIDECIDLLEDLHGRLQTALSAGGYLAASLSHHPVQTDFEGPQNKRRHDYWQWAMQVMNTYGPDINVSLPKALTEKLDLADLSAKVNYYAPAMTALSVASPLRGGRPWEIRGGVGKSLRTHRRSVVAPAIEAHLHEAGRIEFKTFEMSWRAQDFYNYFLLWLELLLDPSLAGRASNQTRIYDLGAVARFGLEAETVAERAAELLGKAPAVLAAHGFDPRPLHSMVQRLETRRTPADELIERYRAAGDSLPALLETLTVLEPMPAEGALSRPAAAARL
jgi:carboxylate-amine ligase